MLSYCWITPQVHPTSLIDMYSNIIIFFLAKNTMSRFAAVYYAGIIRSLKTVYQKKLMRYVIARINDY